MIEQQPLQQVGDSSVVVLRSVRQNICTFVIACDQELDKHDLTRVHVAHDLDEK